MQETLDRLVYTVDETAQILSVSRNLCYRLVREGRIPSVRISNRRVIIPVKALEALLAQAGGQQPIPH